MADMIQVRRFRLRSPAIRSRTSYRIHGMDCAEEVSLLRRLLSQQTGIYDLSFDVWNARMSVEFDPERISEAQIAAVVERGGMGCEPWVEPEQAGRLRSFWRNHGRVVSTAVSGLFLLAGMALHAIEEDSLWASLLQHPDEAHTLPPHVIACYVASILTGFYWGVPKALAALRRLRPEMNSLVFISIIGAGILGEWSEGATLAFLFSLAGLLEMWSLGRAQSAVASLVRLKPTEATLIHSHGDHRVPVERVGVGSLIRIRPGERIPCDGEVVAGSSYVDQALVTGESVPVPKNPGGTVYAGTMNTEGELQVRTTQPASDTLLARMVRMVEGSRQRRAPSEQFVERFARAYTPAMFVLAALVGTIPPLFLGGEWSRWFYQSMVVLLISCPCALIISTPVTIVSALASAAREGVLIKGGAFLEEAARLRVFAFDKTGVLTRGVPSVQSFSTLDGRSESDVLRSLSGLELRSEHTVGRAILQYGLDRGIEPAPEVTAFHALEGRGAEAVIGKERMWVGSNRLLAEKRMDTPGIRQQLTMLEDAEHTAVVFGTDQNVLAVVGLADPVREEAPAMLASLRQLGVQRLVMLTGDNRQTAEAVAQRLRMDSVHAELLPEEKAALIEALRREAGSVAMVGDGVNDAQAMASASVGIALGQRATDVALETADIVLVSDDLEKLPFLLRHARRSASAIRQNVCIALSLKAAFLGLALFGMATLWLAVMADMGATLLVTFNGLRLLRPKTS